MRIKSNLSELVENESGKITMIVDSNDDIWHIFNLLEKGDLVQLKTSRKIMHESNNGNKTSKKVQIFFTLKIDSIDYNSEDYEIRINGKSIFENEYISKGQFQSASIIKNMQFSLIKKSWDAFSINLINEVSNPMVTSDLAICLLDEGTANLFLISSHITLLKSKVELSIPKKRNGSSNHEKAMDKFFYYISDMLLNNINFEIVKCIVIGSPGFLKDQYREFLVNIKNSSYKQYEELFKNEKKLFFVHSSGSSKQSLNEVLSKQDIKEKIFETKAYEDIRLMEKFDEMLALDYEKITFGIKHAYQAIDLLAMDILIITDGFLKKMGPNFRKELHKKVLKLNDNQGCQKVLSSKHVTGEKVDKMGGIVGILKFKIDLEYHEENHINDVYLDIPEVDEKDDNFMEEDFLKDDLDMANMDN